jgi:hypothetical protein
MQFVERFVEQQRGWCGPIVTMFCLDCVMQLWAEGCRPASAPPADNVETTEVTWGSGANINTRLVNPTGEVRYCLIRESKVGLLDDEQSFVPVHESIVYCDYVTPSALHPSPEIVCHSKIYLGAAPVSCFFRFKCTLYCFHAYMNCFINLFVCTVFFFYIFIW